MSEQTVARIRHDGGWDRRFRATCDHGGRPCPRVLHALPLPSVEPQVPLVRVVNLLLSGVLVWMAIIGWALSTFLERGA